MCEENTKVKLIQHFVDLLSWTPAENDSRLTDGRTPEVIFWRERVLDLRDWRFERHQAARGGVGRQRRRLRPDHTWDADCEDCGA